VLVDLHIHTTRFSECSTLDPVDMMKAAKDAGLDGICLTEHQKTWPPDDLADLAKEYDIHVWGGVEVTTTEGDLLAFGLTESVSGIVTPQELRAMVDKAGGALIAAHPFRGFLLFGFQTLSLNLEEAGERNMFKYVDAIEACNCKVTDQENDFARQVGEHLRLPLVGGSDAHKKEEVGICATELPDDTKTVEDIIRAIKNGNVVCRKLK
jgi:predicted metal-dependent phosphoesterase TrpH